MPQGRPRRPGTDEQRAANRRQRVRDNVRAYRQRQRERERQSESGNTQGEASDALEAAPSSANSRSPSAVLSGSSSPEKALQTSHSISIQRPERAIHVTRNVDGGIHGSWSVALPLRLDLGPTYSNAYITAVRDVDPSAPAVSVTIPAHPGSSSAISPMEPIRVDICCWAWTTTMTYEFMSADAEMIGDALLAVALNLLSIELNDRNLLISAMQSQETALRKLRSAFDLYVDNRGLETTSLFCATAMTCSISELMINKSWDGFYTHITGIGAIAEYGGPHQQSDATSRMNFLGYRSLQAPFCFYRRQKTFLAQPEWTNMPWRTIDTVELRPGHTMLDIAFQIPSQMEIYDKSSNRSAAELNEQMRELDQITWKLDEWERGLYDLYPASIYGVEALYMTGPNSDVINFCTDTVAVAFTCYVGVRIHLLRLLRQIAEDLSVYEDRAGFAANVSAKSAYDWSIKALQCINNFFARNDRIAGQVNCLFPFDAAWLTFSELHQNYDMDTSNELRICQGIFEQFEAAGLPVYEIRHRL